MDVSCGVQTRKELVKGNFRETHWNWGSLLLGLGVLIAIEGPANTYLRTGDGPRCCSTPGM